MGAPLVAVGNEAKRKGGRSDGKAVMPAYFPIRITDAPEIRT